eukprot:TRINITY_DN18819_c0_g2_i1.p1 TRINITY_DN18819_c0_g2~~TRINITY_DN18819_c0_g2_i1.p1  ORF type:complete len:938 (+),score=120.91 TRINITY_DN18819_c0_g2_i1:194-3007(+)
MVWPAARRQYQCCLSCVVLLWPTLLVAAVDSACSLDTSAVGAPSVGQTCGAQLCKTDGINCDARALGSHRTLFYSLDDPSHSKFDGEITLISHLPFDADRGKYYGQAQMLYDAQTLFFEWLAKRGGLRVQEKTYSMGVLWVDDELCPEGAAEALRYASQRTGSRLALGGFSSYINNGSAAQAKDDGMLFITAGANAGPIFKAEPHSQPRVFTVLPSADSYDFSLIHTIAKHAKALDDGRAEMPEGAACAEEGCWNSLRMSVLAIGPEGFFCGEALETFTKVELGDGKIAFRDHFSEGVSDAELERALRKYKHDKSTILYVCAADWRDVLTLIDILEKIDYNLFALIARDVAHQDAYLQQVASGWWQGSYVLDSITWNEHSNKTGSFSNMTAQEFTDLFQRRFERDPSWVAAAQFAALCTLSSAIVETSSLDPLVLADKIYHMDLEEFYGRIHFHFGGQVSFLPVVTQVPRSTYRKDPRKRWFFKYDVISTNATHNNTQPTLPMPSWAYRRCTWETANAEGNDCYGHGTCEIDGSCSCDHGWQGKYCQAAVPRSRGESVITLAVVCAMTPAFILFVSSACFWQKRATTRWRLKEQEALSMLEEGLWEQTDDKMSQATRLLAKLGYSRNALSKASHRLRKEQSETAGVSVAYLLSDEFTQLAKLRSGLEDPTFYDLKDAFFSGSNPLGKHALCPRDGRTGCALVDTLEPRHRRQRTHFLSWTWGYRLSIVQDCLKQWIERESLNPAEQFLFMCFFVNNQYRLMPEAGSQAATRELQSTLEDNLKRTGSLVVLLDTWDRPKYLTRAWAIYEQTVAIRNDVPVTVLLTKNATEKLCTQFDKGRSGIMKVMAGISKVDSANAKAFYKEEEVAIKELLLKDSTYNDVNEQIVEGMLRWLSTTASSVQGDSVLVGRPQVPRTHADSVMFGLSITTRRWQHLQRR